MPNPKPLIPQLTARAQPRKLQLLAHFDPTPSGAGFKQGAGVQG